MHRDREETETVRGRERQGHRATQTDAEVEKKDAQREREGGREGKREREDARKVVSLVKICVPSHSLCHVAPYYIESGISIAMFGFPGLHWP